MSIITDNSDKMLNTKEASELSGMSIAWLERQRHLKSGPPTYSIGKRSVRYKLSELLQWLDANRDGGAK